LPGQHVSFPFARLAALLRWLTYITERWICQAPRVCPGLSTL